MMAVSLTQRGGLSVCWFKLSLIYLILGLGLLTNLSVYAQSVRRIDSLPHDGLTLYSDWRWHSGDNPAWASPTFDDSRWDTIRPARSIQRLADVQKKPQGWLRLTFTLDSTVAQTPLALVINQIGATELYVDGVLFQRLGKVGSNFRDQEAYSPTSRDAFMLPVRSAGRHVLAVRLSQHRPPWYMPKFMYFNRSVFGAMLFPADKLASLTISRIYLQTLGNYLIIGIFFMLGIIHFMYYRYRRQWINLFFGLTMLLGGGCIIVIELLGLMTNASVLEWMFLSQGLSIALFMILLLVTYYVYLGQPVSWFFGIVVALLLISRIGSVFTVSVGINIISVSSIVALFADGIRISIAAIRSKRLNARFMLTSILVLMFILIVGGLVGWLVATQYPAYSVYVGAVTNLLFFLTLPISFAVILAREYAQTNRNLEDRLTEVAQLSQEKESILTQQNQTLERQVTERTAELTQSLTELRETQQQLIQREKMASLGELTAGIAHEIQNPLNFVNNFADVSGELVQELKQERAQASRDAELEAELLDDLEQNLQKISHHGGRASSIVRSMLDHSRVSTGQREPTDLNALADEYLRLSYHGVRAKDKNFNAHLITQFDPTVTKVTLVAQDIGRVLLNLFNNAFYAVNERESRSRELGESYQPTVTVSTRTMGKFVEIRVSDNGMGIPESIQRKVFQPFFTTKPTGQGTGLGLSLSYDSITKGHGGEFILENTAGEGATFLIRLPISQKSE
ncbi:ATP-binding protein [Spirosoma migulaei]